MTEKSLPSSRRRTVIIGLVVACIAAAVGGGIFILYESRFVYTDKAEIEAPLIALGPRQPGILKHVYVEEGDHVRASQTLALIGDETINAEVSGVVIDTKGDIGAFYQPGQPVVTMIQPKELRLVAHIDEDKGLKDIYEGQDVEFTVDAFGSRVFRGTVEAVIPSQRSKDVVFSISDKRETKQFDVKIRYDEDEGAAFANGMSARVWIIK